jgi:broad specificity phosphatase PhoE
MRDAPGGDRAAGPATLLRVPAVWLIRHAPAAGNIGGTFMGRLDGQPDADGLTQAATLAGTVGADAVLASPLCRAALTAAAIFPCHAIAHDERLAERHLGAWQGRVKAQVREEQPEAFTPAGTLDLRVTPPGGEPFEALCARVHAVLAELAARPADERIAVVSHNGVLRTARILLGLLSVEQASVTPEPFAQPSRVQVDPTTVRALAHVYGADDGRRPPANAGSA